MEYIPNLNLESSELKKRKTKRRSNSSTTKSPDWKNVKNITRTASANAALPSLHHRWNLGKYRARDQGTGHHRGDGAVGICLSQRGYSAGSSPHEECSRF